MRLTAIEQALLQRGTFLEIASAEGEWAVSLAGPGGVLISPVRSDASMMKVLKEFDATLRENVRTVTGRHRDTTALSILMSLGAVIEIRSRTPKCFIIKMWAPDESLHEHTVKYKSTTLWHALNEAIATMFATISAMHLASTLGH